MKSTHVVLSIPGVATPTEDSSGLRFDKRLAGLVRALIDVVRPTEESGGLRFDKRVAGLLLLNACVAGVDAAGVCSPERRLPFSVEDARSPVIYRDSDDPKCGCDTAIVVASLS